MEWKDIKIWKIIFVSPFLVTNYARQMKICYKSHFFPFISSKFYKQVYTNFLPDFYRRQELVAGGIIQEQIFWFVSSSFCEGRLQQIKKISVQAL